MINIEKLSQFLKEAHKNTYPNKDAPKVPGSRLNSSDYHFEKDDLIYHDTYFGARDFIGSEIVYEDKIPVWGMNYCGYILSPEIKEKELYSFVRKALMGDYEDIIPTRGPKNYTNEKWRYENKVDGGLDRFVGIEEVYLEDKLVYKANYHGGLIVGLENSRIPGVSQ